MTSSYDIQSYIGYLQSVPNLAFDPDDLANAIANDTTKEFLLDHVYRTSTIGGNFFNLNLPPDAISLATAAGINQLDLFLAGELSQVVEVTENWADRSQFFTRPVGGPTTINSQLLQIDDQITTIGGTNYHWPFFPNPVPPIQLDIETLLVSSLQDIADAFNAIPQSEIDIYNSLPAGILQNQWWESLAGDPAVVEARHRLFYSWNFYQMVLQDQAGSALNFSEVLPPASFQDYYEGIQNLNVNPPFLVEGQKAVSLEEVPPTSIGDAVTVLDPDIKEQKFKEIFEEAFSDYLLSAPATSPEQFFGGWFDYISTVFVERNVSQTISTRLISLASPAGVLAPGEDNPLIGSSIQPYQFATPLITDAVRQDLVVNMLGGLINEFATTLQVVDDWAQILPEDETERNLLLTLLLDNTFSAFVQYLSDNPAVVSGDFDFFQEWGNFIGPYIFLGATAEDPSTSPFFTFNDIWNAFFPGDPKFLPELKTLIDNLIVQGAPAIPGLAVDEWFDTVKQRWFDQIAYDPTSSLEVTKFEYVDLLLRIYDLLVGLLGELQKMAAVQVFRERFLSNYEKAYTDRLAQVPVFRLHDKDDPSGEPPISDDSEKHKELRQDFGALNAKYTESLRGYRSVVEDLEKQNRTNVSQTNEAVSQQANIATTILQQFSALLQSIWR